ncbi:hypothetical protein RND81_06G203600 [Saponaria officinalis]|uniref:F-box domain-containing protein n=1 Tax=Saponaria officinalis TaxID=3572 RepID=A0AAW1KF55_SAPOF
MVNKCKDKIKECRVIIDQIEDRLSSLPDELRIQILSRLPLRSAIVTECLSSRWRGLWTNITSVNIEPAGTTHPKYSDEFLNALDKIRSRMVSPFIYRFSFELINGVQGTFRPPYLDSWVQQICDRDVRELKLTETRQFPSFIFRTQSLVSIELRSTSTWVLPDDCEPINLPNLKNLGINLCPAICDWVEKQIKLCPSLEQLSLMCETYYWDSPGKRITCSNQNLRRLSINFKSSKVSHNVVIDAPKLEYLAIRALKTSTFSFTNEPVVLREAKIEIYGTTRTPAKPDKLNRVISKFYEDISNVRFLGLHIDSLDNNLSTFFRNTTKLTLDMDSSHSISMVLSMLELCPALDDLTLKFLHIGDDREWCRHPKLGQSTSKARRPLKTINIECYWPKNYDSHPGLSFLALIEYFLTHATDLERFKVNLDATRLSENVIVKHDESVELELCKLLYQCPTMSKRCEVEFVGRCFMMSRKAGPKAKT